LQTIFYKKIAKTLTQEISQFWKNRVTLIKMGRLYARNIFKNISLLPLAKKINTKSVDCPLLVVGAGISLEQIIPLIKKKSSVFFIIAVDSAIMPLLKHGIIPDAIVSIECQLANEQAFIGLKKYNKNIPFISDLTARAHINNEFSTYMTLFLSEYATTNFLHRIFSAHFSIKKILPMGSVGLNAMYLALQLRKNDTVPIFFTGLDFCYIAGKTHCRDAPHHRFLLNSINRFYSLENMESSFSFATEECQGKRKKMIVTPALKNYAQMFRSLFSSEKNIFDISFDGLAVGMPSLSRKEFQCTIANFQVKKKHPIFLENMVTDEIHSAVTQFYAQEEQALSRLKEIFTTGNGTTIEIEKLLIDREYLYLHFPDGHKLRLDSDFLKRIRSEIDFFIKDIHFGQKNLEKRIKK
ncbi:MAG: 6-hydroxymethylpterin diphosphokinase MptE-like protein, partial [Treponemataceae bacterium]